MKLTNHIKNLFFKPKYLPLITISNEYQIEKNYSPDPKPDEANLDFLKKYVKDDVFK